MNGALTIGTWMGRMWKSGRKWAPRISSCRLDRPGGQRPSEERIQNQWNTMEQLRLQEVMERISSGYFSNGDTELFKPLVDSSGTTTLLCCSRISQPMWTNKRRSSRLSRPGTLDKNVDPQYRPHGQVFPPTAPSVNIAGISGR